MRLWEGTTTTLVLSSDTLSTPQHLWRDGLLESPFLAQARHESHWKDVPTPSAVCLSQLTLVFLACQRSALQTASHLCSKLPGLSTSTCLLSLHLPPLPTSAEAVLTLQWPSYGLQESPAELLGVQVARLRLRSEPGLTIRGQSSPIHFSVLFLLQRPGSRPRAAVVLGRLSRPKPAYTQSHSIFKLLSRVTLPVPKTPGLTRSAGPGSLSSGYICQCAP